MRQIIFILICLVWASDALAQCAWTDISHMTTSPTISPYGHMFLYDDLSSLTAPGRYDILIKKDWFSYSGGQMTTLPSTPNGVLKDHKGRVVYEAVPFNTTSNAYNVGKLPKGFYSLEVLNGTYVYDFTVSEYASINPANVPANGSGKFGVLFGGMRLKDLRYHRYMGYTWARVGVNLDFTNSTDNMWLLNQACPGCSVDPSSGGAGNNIKDEQCLYDKLRKYGINIYAQIGRFSYKMHPTWGTVTNNMSYFKWAYNYDLSDATTGRVELSKALPTSDNDPRKRYIQLTASGNTNCFTCPPTDDKWSIYSSEISSIANLLNTNYQVKNFEFITEPGNFMFAGYQPRDVGTGKNPVISIYKNGSPTAESDNHLLNNNFEWPRMPVFAAAQKMLYHSGAALKAVPTNGFKLMGIGDGPNTEPYSNSPIDRIFNGYKDSDNDAVANYGYDCNNQETRSLTLNRLETYSLSQGGSPPLLDILTTHAYIADGLPEGNSRSIGKFGVGSLKDLTNSTYLYYYEYLKRNYPTSYPSLASLKSQIPLWSTECGITSVNSNDGQFGGYSASEGLQCSKLPRYHIMMEEAGISKIIHFEFTDVDTFGNSYLGDSVPPLGITDLTYRNFTENNQLTFAYGIQRRTGTFKPSFSSVRTNISKLEGRKLLYVKPATSVKGYFEAFYSTSSSTDVDMIVLWSSDSSSDMYMDYNINQSWGAATVTRNLGQSRKANVIDNKVSIHLDGDEVVYIEKAPASTFTTSGTSNATYKAPKILITRFLNGKIYGIAYYEDLLDKKINLRAKLCNSAASPSSADIAITNAKYEPGANCVFGKDVNGDLPQGCGFVVTIPTRFQISSWSSITFVDADRTPAVDLQPLISPRLTSSNGDIVQNQSGVCPSAGAAFRFSSSITQQPLVIADWVYTASNTTVSNPTVPPYNPGTTYMEANYLTVRGIVVNPYNISVPCGFALYNNNSSTPTLSSSSTSESTSYVNFQDLCKKEGIEYNPSYYPNLGYSMKIATNSASNLDFSTTNMYAKTYMAHIVGTYASVNSQPVSVKIVNNPPYGEIDMIDYNSGKITGWARDDDSKQLPVSVKIDVYNASNHILITTFHTKASLVREINGVAEKCGFEAPLPSLLSSSYSGYDFRVYAVDNENGVNNVVPLSSTKRTTNASGLPQGFGNACVNTSSTNASLYGCQYVPTLVGFNARPIGTVIGIDDDHNIIGYACDPTTLNDGNSTNDIINVRVYRNLPSDGYGIPYIPASPQFIEATANVTLSTDYYEKYGKATGAAANQGFKIPLSSIPGIDWSCGSTVANTLTVWAHDRNNNGINNELLRPYFINYTNRRPIGRIQRVSSSGLMEGWAFDPDSPKTPIQIELCVNNGWANDPSKCTGRFVTNTFSSSLSDITGTSNTSGFTKQLGSPLIINSGSNFVYGFGIDLKNDSPCNGMMTPEPYYFLRTGSVYSRVQAESSEDIRSVGDEIYPNPTSSLINFPKAERVVIYNLSGNVVGEANNVTRYDISNFPQGMYSIVLFRNGQYTTKRIIKQ